MLRYDNVTMRVSQGETAFAPSGRCASARGQPARPQPKAVDGPPLAGTQVCPPAPLLGLLAFFKCWMGYLLTPRCARCRPADKTGKVAPYPPCQLALLESSLSGSRRVLVAGSRVGMAFTENAPYRAILGASRRIPAKGQGQGVGAARSPKGEDTAP